MPHVTWIPLLFAATLHAQSGNPLAYPQDTLIGFNGNNVPLGARQLTGHPPVTEAHTQLLFPADHLPSTGGTLVGIAVCAHDWLAVTYASLNIDASVATVTALSMVFAQNLLAPSPVLAAQSLPVAYTPQTWTPIMFTTPFAYPGGLNLVLDIRKILVPPGTGTQGGLLGMQVTSDPSRNDLPQMVYAFGGWGSGASTATIATTAMPTLQVRLLWAGIPTMTLLSDPLGGTGNPFARGGSLTITTYGTPASLYLTQAGTGLVPVPVPPVAGLMYVGGVTLGIGFLNASGRDARTLSIPSNPRLFGMHLAFQSGVLDSVTNGASWTCAADAFIN